MKKIVILLIAILFFSCTTNSDKNKTVSDSSNTLKSSKPLISNQHLRLKTDSNLKFENNIYLIVNQVWIGNGYTDSKNRNVFYRIIQAQQEEDITLVAEKISTGEEDGNYQLLKRDILTNEKSIFPYGLSSVDSLKFIDSVKIQGYFNQKKMVINLEKKIID